VKAYVVDHGPAVSPNGVFANSARTRQWKIPVPYMSTGVAEGARSPLKSLWVPSGWSTETSYETAPGTGLHAQFGIASP